MYAYHTNARGIYPAGGAFPGPAARRHGSLRGWVRTDSLGRYRFHSIRPAGYPNSDLPQHVHMHVLEPGRCTYPIDDVLFDDDPRLTPRQRQFHARGRGGRGIAVPVRDASGTWRVRRDIILGAGIARYERCTARRSEGSGAASGR